jgi:ribosomal protein S18 acetylase RimI-like enzyme
MALDAMLAARGYRQIDFTSVQGRPLAGGQISMAGGVNVFEGDEGLARWLDLFHAINPGRHDVHTHKAILERVIGRICPLVLSDGKEIVACGLGVLQGHLLGLFDIVTRESDRRRGYGRAVTESLLAWGEREGAAYAYLQVMLSNEPARRLYEQSGFSEQYRYWYRVCR